MSTEMKMAVPNAFEEQHRGRLVKSAPRGRSSSSSAIPGIIGATFFAMLGTWTMPFPGVLEHVGIRAGGKERGRGAATVSRSGKFSIGSLGI